MELGSILEFLDNKSVLVTGATGFLAKILVEKILRVQPNVKKLYLLVRATDAKSASQRLQTEMIGKDLFRVIKEKWGANLQTYISEKVTAVAGDITAEKDLGVKDSILVEEMVSQVDVIVNLAATTNFDDRYDVSLRLNTLGANNVLSFAKRCAKIKVLVHVSTAYVSGEKEGLILESPYQMGEALNGRPGLDVLVEQKVVEATLKDLRDQRASESEIKVAMKDLGIKRAKMYGWPNTYVFTKAMGEMMIGEFKGTVPIAVIRPTIVTSTFKEPFPGWVEGVRTIDSLAVGYAKGKIQCFLGDLKAVVDVIPADMVVNSILVAAAAHANQPSDHLNIYQIGSSVRNPVRYGNLQDYGKRYFTKKPWINKDGKPVIVGQVTVLDSMESFHRYMTIRYLLLLKGLELVNTTFCQYFKRMYTNMNRKISFVMRLVELYKPYLFFKGVFDDINAERLRMAAREGGVETDMFDFDTKNINWDDYFMNTHLPGIVKYVFK